MNKRIKKKHSKLHTTIYQLPIVQWTNQTPRWKRKNQIQRAYKREVIKWGFGCRSYNDGKGYLL